MSSTLSPAHARLDDGHSPVEDPAGETQRIDDEEELALFGSASEDEPEDEDEADLSHFAGTSATDPLRPDFSDAASSYFGSQAQIDYAPDNTLPVEEASLVDLPRVGEQDQVFQFELPRFLRADPKLFHDSTYEGIDGDDEQELATHTESTMRWRTMLDPSTQESLMESNAQLVEWSDGSYGILVGGELYDGVKQPVRGAHYLANVQYLDELLVTESPINELIKIKMPDALAAAKRFRASKSSIRRTHGTQLIELDIDPEKEHEDRVRAEKEAIKAQRKMESQKRRMAKRYEGDDDDIGAGSRRGSSRRSAGRNSRVAGDEFDLDNPMPSSLGDDLNGFVVSDDDEIVEFDEADEAEEHEQMLSGGNSLRRLENNRAHRAEALARQRGGMASAHDDDLEEFITQSRLGAVRRAVLDDEEYVD